MLKCCVWNVSYCHIFPHNFIDTSIFSNRPQMAEISPLLSCVTLQKPHVTLTCHICNLFHHVTNSPFSIETSISQTRPQMIQKLHIVTGHLWNVMLKFSTWNVFNNITNFPMIPLIPQSLLTFPAWMRY